MKDNRVKIFIAELIGTMVLVLGGCGTAVFAGSHEGVGTLGVAFAFGLSVLVMAYAIGPISGCHINPAVTLGLVVAKKVKAGLIPLYWVAQFAGATIGGLIILIIANGDKAFDMDKVGFATNGFGSNDTGSFYSLGAVALAEIILTMIFVHVVVSTTRKDFAQGFGGIAAGLTITLVHLIAIPIDNTSVNPARSFGVAIFKGGDALSQYWAFAVFPLVGAIIAGIVATYVLTEPKKIES